MNEPLNDSSPIPKAKRETVSKYPRLENGHPVGSLDPAPIESRDRDIDMIWRNAVPHFKMCLNDIVIKFDVAILQFTASTPPQALNAVREAIMKRLDYDGIKTGRIAMSISQKNHHMELLTPGYQVTPATLQKEIFSLIAVKHAPRIAPDPKNPR